MKNQISPQQILHIGHLAKIRLSKQDVKKYQKQLSSILEFMESLNKLNTTHIPETSQTTGLFNKLREDKVHPSLKQKDVLQNAPRQSNGFIKVKTVLGRST